MSNERVRELIDSKQLQKRYTPAETGQLLSAYDPRQLSAEERALAIEIRDKFNRTLEAAQKADVLDEGIQQYATQSWRPEEGANPANRLLHEAQQGAFSTNTTMARQRIFDNAFEGQLLGKKLAETDPIALAANNANAFSRIIAAREAIRRLKESDVRGSDGRPLVALSGRGSVLDGEDSSSIFVNPNSVTKSRIPDAVVESLKTSGDLQRGLRDGHIVDVTKRITMDNVSDAIDLLEHKAIGSTIKFDEEGNNLIRQQINQLKSVRDGKLPASKLAKINDAQPSVYAWNPHDYKSVDHSSFRDWKHVASDAAGSPVMLKSDMLVHPEAATYLERRLGLDSKGPADNAIGKALLKANAEGKGLMLFGSPFHVMQEALRGLMVGVSPFGMEKWDLATDPQLRKGVEDGLTLGRDYRGLKDFQEGSSDMSGHSVVISKVPGLNRVQHGLDEFLFKKYIPSLKVRAYRTLLSRYQEAYPEWTADKVSESAVTHANELFGGINYKKLGRSAAAQNWSRLALLAPDWLESEVRSMARAVGSEGKLARRDMLRATAILWTTARVLNYAMTGNFHNEAPFGVAVKGDDGKEKVFSIRTLPSDALHAVSDPIGFIHGRFSPLVRTGTELVSGRDDHGRKLEKPNLLFDLMRNVAPIPVQSTVKSITGEAPDTSTREQIAKAAGLTVLPYRSEAQKLADTLASDRSETGTVDLDKLKAHRLQLRIEEAARLGEIPTSDITGLASEAGLGHQAVKAIRNNFRETRDLDPEQAGLYLRASRLPMDDFIRVFDKASPVEKQTLEPLMRKKRLVYILKVRRDLPATERSRDTLYQKLLLQ